MLDIKIDPNGLIQFSKDSIISTVNKPEPDTITTLNAILKVHKDFETKPLTRPELVQVFKTLADKSVSPKVFNNSEFQNALAKATA